jgi:hypothetical protein
MTPLELPDEPRWVEAHGIAADPAGWRRSLGDGFAVGHDAARLVVVASDADDDAVIALARELTTHALLVADDDLAAALRSADRTSARAILHTLPEPDALLELDGAIRLPLDAELAHLPAPLADELRWARSRSKSIWTAYVDGAPVAFAYAPWRSTRWFDVSVDTLPSARQLGLATIVATAMIHDERAAGREPVWSADEANAPSLRLAAKLGFVAVDEIWIAPPAL